MSKLYTIITFVLFCGFQYGFSQEADLDTLDNPKVEQALATAQDAAQDGDFALAEQAYKKALGLDPTRAAAAYNLGVLLDKNDKAYQSNKALTKAIDQTEDKALKHKIFHNIGNSFYKNKEYQKAVEAYKEALRNDPTDEETRYNLALAKKEKEKQGGGGGGGGDEKDPNKDKQPEEQDQEKSKDGDQDEKQSGDQKGDNDQPKDGDDKKEGGDQKDEQGKDSKGDQKGDKPQQEKGQQPSQRQGQMSPQQIKQLLDAMNNEEKKIQDKIKARKGQKGNGKKTEKDW